jgi:hypothetical protein
VINNAKYEWWHGFNPDKIADQVEPQDRWYIIVVIICVLPLHSATSGVWLMWSALLPAFKNPPKVNQYATEMKGYWRELLLLFPCIFVFSYLEIRMHQCAAGLNVVQGTVGKIFLLYGNKPTI